jgi:hypothetical protein
MFDRKILTKEYRFIYWDYNDSLENAPKRTYVFGNRNPNSSQFKEKMPVMEFLNIPPFAPVKPTGPVITRLMVRHWSSAEENLTERIAEYREELERLDTFDRKDQTAYKIYQQFMYNRELRLQEATIQKRIWKARYDRLNDQGVYMWDKLS